MGFKLTLEIDVDVSPDPIGEALRSKFFDEKIIPVSSRMMEVGCQPYRETGCYSTFDWQKDVKELPPILVDPDDDYPNPATWTRGEKEGIECRYYWDGDGTLAFKLPDGRWLVNYDCKKDHEWMLLEPGEEI
jgi:hypothetical protein